MELDKIIQLDKMYYMNTFGDRVPVCFEYGKGINLWDTKGKMYYDFMAGIAVNALGHSHPSLVATIKEQAEKLIHCSNYYYIKQQALLAEKLAGISCAKRVFFANSGAEANEGAIKLAKLYYKKKGFEDKYEIITLKNSFHGRTLTTLAATGQEKYQKPFTPLTPGFKSVPIDDWSALKEAVNEKTCAIMLELIQGEGGVNPVDFDYVAAVRELCNELDILLIFDEIQTGMGRTGKMFAYEQYEVEPDIFTLAKALGGGIPIGAVCAGEKVADTFAPGEHGSTFGGNPLACAAALTVIDEIIKNKLYENAEKMGIYFVTKLNDLKNKYPFIIEIRGMGLMIGIELENGKAALVKEKCFENGYLIGNIGTNIIRMLPPLIVTKEDIDGMIETFDKVFGSLN